MHSVLGAIGSLMSRHRAPLITAFDKVGTFDEIAIIGRLTGTLSKGICQTQQNCACKSGDRVRCHAVRRYSGLMTPVARHLFKAGEYNHGKD